MKHVLLPEDKNIINDGTVTPPNELSHSDHESSSEKQKSADKKIGNVSLLVVAITKDLRDPELNKALKQYLIEKDYFTFVANAKNVIDLLENRLSGAEKADCPETLATIIQIIGYIKEVTKLFYETSPFDAHEKSLLELKNTIEEYNNTDPFVIAYNKLRAETKLEVANLRALHENDLYNWTMNDKAIRSKKQRSEGLLARLSFIVPHEVYDRDTEIQEIKTKYPFSSSLQILKNQLNQIDSDLLNLRDELYYKIDQIHLGSQNHRDEHVKLIEFEQLVVNYYYKVRETEKNLENQSLGNALMDFIQNNIANKYSILIPKIITDKDKQANILLLADLLAKHEDTNPIRVAQITIDEAQNLQADIITKLKYEYDEVVLITNSAESEASIYSNHSVYKSDPDEQKKNAREIFSAKSILEENNIRVHLAQNSNEAKDTIQKLYPDNTTGVLFTKEPNDIKISHDKHVSLVLKKYIRVRLQQERERGSEYNGLFGWSWFSIMSSSLKRSAAETLFHFIEYENKLAADPYNLKLILNPPKKFTTDQISALTEGTLGDRLKLYGYDENKINEIQKKMIEYKNKALVTQRIQNDSSDRGIDLEQTSIEKFILDKTKNVSTNDYEKLARNTHILLRNFGKTSVPDVNKKDYALKGKKKAADINEIQKNKEDLLNDWVMIDSYKSKKL